MKNIVVLIVLVLFSSSANAKDCRSGYEYDPCPVDGYSVVEVERFVKGVHNQMYCVHHFNDEKRTYRVKRRHFHRYYRR